MVPLRSAFTVSPLCPSCGPVRTSEGTNGAGATTCTQLAAPWWTTPVDVVADTDTRVASSTGVIALKVCVTVGVLDTIGAVPSLKVKV